MLLTFGILLIKKKFSLGVVPTDGDKKKSYENREKSLFGSLLTDTALEWFNTVDQAKVLNDIKGDFLDRFTDGRDKFKHRLEVKNASRQEGELKKNYFHRVKHVVDKGWPEDLTKVDNANRTQEAVIQSRQREQKYIDFAIRGLKLPSLKWKAHERRIKKPNKSWDDLKEHLITQDLTCIVIKEILAKQPSDKISSLEIQINELTSLIKNNEVSAIQGTNNFNREPNIKGRANNTRFCEYCRYHGHSISTCNKKKLDDEVQKIRIELLEQKETKTTVSNNYRRCAWNNDQYNSRNNTDNHQAQNPNSFYDNQNSYKYGNRFNQNKQYDQLFPRENSFRQNEYAARQFYERENGQFNRNQAHSKIRPTLQQDTKSYNTHNEHNVRWIQQEENSVDYCDAISVLFPLN